MSLKKTFMKRKAEGKKLAIVTCYDYWSARILNSTEVDGLLVGDCVEMVVHGSPNTLFADVETIALHVKAVAKGATDKFVIASMPAFSIQKGLSQAIENVQTLVQAGAQAVKVEGAHGNEDIIREIVETGVPVIGHVGLMPSHHYMTGGFRVQGRDEDDAETIVAQARAFERLGAVAIVLEAVPAARAGAVRDAVQIPVIGVGAGPDCDGQALVLHDLLGVVVDFKPKFVRTYLDGASLITDAVNRFVADVRTASFPGPAEQYR